MPLCPSLPTRLCHRLIPVSSLLPHSPIFLTPTPLFSSCSPFPPSSFTASICLFHFNSSLPRQLIPNPPVAGAYRRGCLPFHCVRQALRALMDLPVPNQPLGLPPPCPTPAPGVTSPCPSNAPAEPVSSSPLLCSAWPWAPSWAPLQAYTLAWPQRGA